LSFYLFFQQVLYGAVLCEAESKKSWWFPICRVLAVDCGALGRDCERVWELEAALKKILA
jgi:hypothetical protein